MGRYWWHEPGALEKREHAMLDSSANTEWERPLAHKRAATKSAGAELASVVKQLREALPGDWWASASRGELEVVVAIGDVSMRIKRRLQGKKWLCTAWTPGVLPDDGLQIAHFRADDAVGALAGGLEQIAGLKDRLRAVTEAASV